MYDEGFHMTPGHIAAYHMKNHKIYVNENACYFRDPVGVREKLKADGMLSTDHPFGPVWHEYGHRATVGADEFDRLGGRSPMRRWPSRSAATPRGKPPSSSPRPSPA
jgi:hypothetical protein